MGARDKVELGNLTGMLRKIDPALDSVREPTDPAERTSKNAEFVEAVSQANVRHAVKEISARSAVLREMKVDHAIDIVGATYDVASGAVEFLPEG